MKKLSEREIDALMQLKTRRCFLSCTTSSAIILKSFVSTSGFYFSCRSSPVNLRVVKIRIPRLEVPVHPSNYHKFSTTLSDIRRSLNNPKSGFKNVLITPVKESSNPLNPAKAIFMPRPKASTGVQAKKSGWASKTASPVLVPSPLQMTTTVMETTLPTTQVLRSSIPAVSSSPKKTTRSRIRTAPRTPKATAQPKSLSESSDSGIDCVR